MTHLAEYAGRIEAMDPHVLAIVEQFWHRNPGGTATATEKTLFALHKHTKQPMTALAARHSRKDRTDPARLRVPAGVEIKFHWLWRPIMYESWLRQGPGSIDRYTEPGSVCWASSLIVPTTRRPVLATVHDLEFLRNKDFLTRRGRYFFPLVWKNALANADHFVCPSQVVADDCVTFGADQEKVSVVPWGVNSPEASEAEASELARELELPETYALWVGALEHRKNPVGAAEAAAKAGCQLLVVGNQGHPDNTVRIETLPGQVTRLPWLDEKGLSAVYRKAAVLLYPSFAEGFGLPVLEAMAHGTPVITSKRGATQEVAGGAAMLIDPNNVTEMAEALSAAMFDPGQRSKLVNAGLKRAKQMSWHNTAKGYAKALRGLSG